jgi:hypothetical protein
MLEVWAGRAARFSCGSFNPRNFLTVLLPVADAHAAFVGSKVVQYLSEDLGDGVVLSKGEKSAALSESAADRRRVLLSAMTQNSAALLSLQIQSASHYLQAAVAATAENAAEVRVYEAAVGAALGAIAALVAWLPMRVMHESSLVEACSALMRVEGFRGPVLEILLQVCAAAELRS